MMLIVSVKKLVIASMLGPFYRTLLLQKTQQLTQLLSKQQAEKECYASCQGANHGTADKPEVLDQKVLNKQAELSYEG